MYTSREFYSELLNKCSNIMIGDNFTFKFLDTKDRIRNSNLKIFLDFHLTAKTPVVFDLLPIEEACLSWKDLPTAFKNLNLALSAVGLSTACGRQENLLLGQGAHQRATRCYLEGFLAGIDINLDCSRWSQLNLDPQQENHEDHRHYRDSRCCGYNCN